MNPVDILQSRIEQLEARLGLLTSAENGNGQPQPQSGDTATDQLLNAASYINNATAGQEKLVEATQRATELNNYTDPNYIEKTQQGEAKAQAIETAEPVILRHCHCAHHCREAQQALESEAMQEVPQMQQQLEQLQTTAAELKAESDAVASGVQRVIESSGAEAAAATEGLVNAARKVEATEAHVFPKRRNGLD